MWDDILIQPTGINDHRLLRDGPKNCIPDLGYTYKVQGGYSGIGRKYQKRLHMEIIEIDYTLLE